MADHLAAWRAWRRERRELAAERATDRALNSGARGLVTMAGIAPPVPTTADLTGWAVHPAAAHCPGCACDLAPWERPFVKPPTGYDGQPHPDWLL